MAGLTSLEKRKERPAPRLRCLPGAAAPARGWPLLGKAALACVAAGLATGAAEPAGRGTGTAATPPPGVSARAWALHRKALVFDAHVHMINRQFYGGGDIGEALADGQVDLPRLAAGGVDAIFFSLFVTEEYYPARLETRQTLRLHDLAVRQIARNRDRIEIALHPAELERIVRQGKIAAVLDLEGGFDLDGDLAVLRQLHRLGFRALQLTAHNWANNFAETCCTPGPVKGLTERGRAVIREMNRLGMMINVSHAGEATIAQAIDESRAPLVATHHGLRHFNHIPRTMPDALLKQLAAKGGVIGFHMGNEFHNRRMYEYRLARAGGRPFWDVSAVGKRVASLSIEQIDALHKTKEVGGAVVAPKAGNEPEKADKVQGPGHKAAPADRAGAPDALLMTVNDWVGVVDYAINLVGEDHVALGTDFDGGPTLPRGMRDARDVALITEAMLKRGYSEGRIRKFLGGNLLRVWRAVARAAEAPRQTGARAGR